MIYIYVCIYIYIYTYNTYKSLGSGSKAKHERACRTHPRRYLRPPITMQYFIVIICCPSLLFCVFLATFIEQTKHTVFSTHASCLTWGLRGQVWRRPLPKTQVSRAGVYCANSGGNSDSTGLSCLICHVPCDTCRMSRVMWFDAFYVV